MFVKSTGLTHKDYHFAIIAILLFFRPTQSPRSNRPHKIPSNADK